jgi:hypothetical protein
LGIFSNRFLNLPRKLKSVSTADTIEFNESFAHHAAVKSNEERAYMFLAVSLSVRWSGCCVRYMHSKSKLLL